MTVTYPSTFNVKSVAIIGAGPSGIASLHELSRLTKDGKTLFGLDDISEYEKNNDLAFPEIVAFERNNSIGGVWNKNAYGLNNTDPKLPNFEEDLENEKLDLNKPENIYKNIEINEELEEKLKNSSFENPVKIPLSNQLKNKIKNQWRSSAAYTGLFTNVTNRYMMYSFHEKIGEELEKINNKYEYLPNFESSDDVANYLEEVVEKKNLKKYIRFNSNVERVKKLSNGKWLVTTSFESIDENDGSKYLNWYNQYFDAVIIGNGKTIPIVPSIKNLLKFANINKDKVDVRLAKSIQNTDFIKNAKKPLFIGSSVSSVDLIQYAFPRSIENPSIYISRRSPVSGLNWLSFCSYSKGIINKPEIEEFLPESNSVKFTDGTIEKDFDVIVICCGYHMHYPFLDKTFIDSNPENALNWFRYTFSIADPTLALVGNTYAGFFFNRVESQAAAVAGIWSNQKQLPSVTKQINESKDPEALITGRIEKAFISPLMDLAVDGRPHPFTVNKEKSDHVFHTAEGMLTIQSLFFKIRNGEVNALSVTSV
jgi:cation diffusion facilitator CzcD-associated flavoprotein CzcO